MFDPARWPEVVRQALSAPPGRVAFDMDGTLIEGDVGEAVLKRAIERGRPLPGLRALLGPGEPWAAYARALAEGPPERDHFACALGAEGWTVAEVQAQVAALFAEAVVRPRPAVARLAAALRAAGHEVWIVTGSLTAVARAVPPRVGVEVDGVLGQEVVVRDRRHTAERRGPILCGVGKIAAWEAVHDEPPLLMVGDTPNDVPLMRHATLGGLAVPRRGTRLVQVARDLGIPLALDID